MPGLAWMASTIPLSLGLCAAYGLRASATVEAGTPILAPMARILSPCCRNWRACALEKWRRGRPPCIPFGFVFMDESRPPGDDDICMVRPFSGTLTGIVVSALLVSVENARGSLSFFAEPGSVSLSPTRSTPASSLRELIRSAIHLGTSPFRNIELIPEAGEGPDSYSVVLTRLA